MKKGFDYSVKYTALHSNVVCCVTGITSGGFLGATGRLSFCNQLYRFSSRAPDFGIFCFIGHGFYKQG